MLIIYDYRHYLIILTLFSFVVHKSLSLLITSETLIALNSADSILCQNCTKAYVNNYICYRNQTVITDTNGNKIVASFETIGCVCEPGYELLYATNSTQSRCLFVDYPLVVTANQATSCLNQTTIATTLESGYCLENDGILCDFPANTCVCKSSNQLGDYCELTRTGTVSITPVECKQWGFTGPNCSTLKADLIALIVVLSIVLLVALFSIPIALYVYNSRFAKSGKKKSKDPKEHLKEGTKTFFTNYEFSKRVRTIYLPSTIEENHENTETVPTENQNQNQ